MSESNVVPIPGRAAYSAAIPQQAVIDMLSEALDAAKRGEIQGLGLCYVGDRDNVVTDWASGAASDNLMVAAVGRLHFRMMRAATEG